MRILVLVAVVGASVAGTRLVAEHDEYWEWALVPSASPPEVMFEGSDLPALGNARCS